MTCLNLQRQVQLNPINGLMPEGRLAGGKMRSLIEWRNIKTNLETSLGEAIGEGRAIVQRHINEVDRLIQEMEALAEAHRVSV
jgi:hypothetical protein